MKIEQFECLRAIGKPLTDAPCHHHDCISHGHVCEELRIKYVRFGDRVHVKAKCKKPA